MKKKKENSELTQHENSIIKDLRDQKWLYNPVVYSQICGDFTLLQQRVLAGILEKIQEKILRSINEKEENKIFPSLFSEDEVAAKTTEIEISPSYFGISHENYSYLEEAIKDLASIRIGFPKAYKDKMNYVMAPLFSRIELPIGERRRTGKVRVVMLNENLQDFFSMDKGYTEYLSRITKISKKVRTPRIYIFLSSFQNIGHKKVLYEDFCKFLGIDDDTAQINRMNRINQRLINKEITQKEAREQLDALSEWDNPFRNFTKVKSQILEPAKQELDTFSDKAEIDITFEYEPLYEGEKKSGNPSHIMFKIIKKKLALEHDEEKRIVKVRRSLALKLSERYADIKLFDLKNLIDEVAAEDIDDFCDFCHGDLMKKMEKRQPDAVGAYVMTVTENWLKDRNKKKMDKKTSETHSVPICPAYDFRKGDGQDKWELLLEACGDKERELLQRAKYLGLRNGAFCINVTQEDDEEWKAMEKGLSAVYDTARRLLGLPRLAPPIVKGTKN